MNSEANARRIAMVESCFGASGQPLNVPGRVLVGEGVLTKMCRKKPKPRQFFLFNDILVYGNIVLNKKKYNKQHVIPLEEVQLSSLEDDGQYRNGWLIKTPTKSFAVYAATSTEKSEWMAHINKCVTDLLRKSGKKAAEKHAAVWIPDGETSVCMLCKKSQFTLINRRHHCRKCGKVVCGPCSSKKMVLQHQSTKPLRVCLDCYDELAASHSTSGINTDPKLGVWGDDEDDGYEEDEEDDGCELKLKDEPELVDLNDDLSSVSLEIPGPAPPPRRGGAKKNNNNTATIDVDESSDGQLVDCDLFGPNTEGTEEENAPPPTLWFGDVVDGLGDGDTDSDTDSEYDEEGDDSEIIDNYESDPAKFDDCELRLKSDDLEGDSFKYQKKCDGDSLINSQNTSKDENLVKSIKTSEGDNLVKTTKPAVENNVVKSPKSSAKPKVTSSVIGKVSSLMGHSLFKTKGKKEKINVKENPGKEEIPQKVQEENNKKDKSKVKDEITQKVQEGKNKKDKSKVKTNPKAEAIPQIIITNSNHDESTPDGCVPSKGWSGQGYGDLECDLFGPQSADDLYDDSAPPTLWWDDMGTEGFYMTLN